MHEKKAMSDLGRLSIEEFKLSPKIPVWIILDNVRSGLNVGGIFRTADAFSVEAVYCCGYTPSPPHREILKSALGATETVPYAIFDSTLEAITKLKSEGVSCYAVEQTVGSIDLMSFTFRNQDKIALIFGNEVHGVDQNVIHACDGAIEVGQTGTKHSLNVSVCAGILIHQLSFRFQLLKK